MPLILLLPPLAVYVMQLAKRRLIEAGVSDGFTAAASYTAGAKMLA